MKKQNLIVKLYSSIIKPFWTFIFNFINKHIISKVLKLIKTVYLLVISLLSKLYHLTINGVKKILKLLTPSYDAMNHEQKRLLRIILIIFIFLFVSSFIIVLPVTNYLTDSLIDLLSQWPMLILLVLLTAVVYVVSIQFKIYGIKISHHDLNIYDIERSIILR